MAKNHYSADSAPLPQTSLPSDGGKIVPLEIVDFPALFPRQPVPAAEVFLLTRPGYYIGENANFDRRLPEHDAVRRKGGISSPISFD